MKDLNATQAAIRAGYSKKSANTIGNENLLKPIIKTEIQRRLDERKLSADQVLIKLSEIVNSDDPEEVKDQIAKERNRLKALELVGRYHKLFVDKTETEHSGSINININGLEQLLDKVYGDSNPK